MGVGIFHKNTSMWYLYITFGEGIVDIRGDKRSEKLPFKQRFERGDSINSGYLG